MSGSIDTNHFVEHMSGGFHGSPGVVAWGSGSGSTLVDGGFTNPFPGPPAFENQGSDPAWRAFHRSVIVGNSVDGVTFFAWHRNVIYANDAPPNWSSVHTCVSMRTDATSRYGGDHTGLYPVMDRDGSTLWIVGFYRTTSDTIGVVKYNTLTDTWTSFDTGASSHTVPFSVCTQWRGQLAHAGGNSGELLLFDPQTDVLQVIGYTGSQKDWIHQLQGRLFIASRTGTNLRLLEFVAGGFLNHGSTSGSDNTNSEGGWSVIPYTDAVLYIPYYSTTGGSGWRCEKVAAPTTTPGDTVTMSDLTSVIPDGTDVGVGNYSWPAGGAGQAIQQFLPGLDCAEWPRGAFGTTGGIFGGFHISAPVAAPDKYSATHDNVAWNGEGSPISSGSPTVGTNMTGIYSYPITRWGRGLKDYAGGTGPWIESVNRYSDAVVSRGLLIRFRHHGYGEAKAWQALFGYPVAQYAGPGITPCALSLGEGIDPGGVAVLNTAGPGGDSIDQVWGEFFNGGDPQALLSHDAPTVGGPFTVGETVSSSGTGVGTVRAVDATRNRLIVEITAGTFLDTEVITGGSSGTVATLNADEDTDPLYQVIWDLDADSIPDEVFTELSTVTIPNATARPPGSISGYVVGPVQQVYVVGPNGPALTFSGGTIVPDPSADGTGLTNPSEVEEPVALTDASPPINASEVEEPVALTDGAPPTSASEVEEPLIEGDYPGNMRRRVTDRAHTEPGSLPLQVDGVDQGGDRDTVNFIPGLPPRIQVSQGAIADGNYKAQINPLFAETGLQEIGRLATATLAVGPGDTVVYTVPTGFEAVIFAATLRVTSSVGVTAPATAGIGSNAPDYDNLFQSQTLFGLIDVGDVFDYPRGGVAPTLPAGTNVFLGIDTGITGTGQSVELVLFGYLREDP